MLKGGKGKKVVSSSHGDEYFNTKDAALGVLVIVMIKCTLSILGKAAK